MPRAIWRGAISFGMVSIPIRLFTATQSKTIRFNQLRRENMVRVRNKKWDPERDEEVADEEIVRGFEFSKDQYVVLEDEDFENLPVPSAHTVALTRFVEAGEITPAAYDKTYYLEPEEAGVKPFALLIRALEQQDLVAVGKIALRQRESLCALRPKDGHLLLTTLFYADEIRITPEIEIDDVEVGEAEIAMANQLIEMLRGPFEPGEHKDEYREALMERITAKVEGREFVEAKEAAPAEAVDLVAALKASIEAADGSAEAEAPAAKKPPAKKPSAKRTRKKKTAAKA